MFTYTLYLYSEKTWLLKLSILYYIIGYPFFLFLLGCLFHLGVFHPSHLCSKETEILCPASQFSGLVCHSPLHLFFCAGSPLRISHYRKSWKSCSIGQSYQNSQSFQTRSTFRWTPVPFCYTQTSPEGTGIVSNAGGSLCTDILQFSLLFWKRWTKLDLPWRFLVGIAHHHNRGLR